MPARPRCLIDTNVIVYAEHHDSSAKQAAARAVLRECARTRSGALSTQVLLETYDVLVRRARDEASRSKVAEHVGRLAVALPVLPASAQTVLLAADCSRRHGLRIFDAMLWSVATIASVPWVLTEDIGHRRTIDGVTFVDPFAEDFDLAQIGVGGD